jgi:uncharacterized membrane protein
LKTNRLEAFSDGVLAIILTIMVLELKVPHSAEWKALLEASPVFLSYTLSFVYIAIYWNNHHHLFHAVVRVNGSILWANNNLLFWLSLVPFATAWAGENDFARQPTIIYGCALLMAALSFTLLQWAIIRSHADDKALSHAIGKDFKGKISLVLYLTGIVTGFFQPIYSYAAYVAVAMIWMIPDRRIEESVEEAAAEDEVERASPAKRE